MVQIAASSRLRMLTFLYLWASSGFFLGTLLLLGPVRWITNILRAKGSSENLEDLVVLLAIGILFVISVVAARLLNGPATAGDWNARRLGALILPGALAVAATGLWMNPNLLVDRYMPSGPPQHFFIGPYPQEEDLERIKENGYTAVISLLHPAIVPFEPKLIRDERAAAEDAGIKLIEIPMLPWVSKNSEALEKIRKLSADTSARYYVHCYLGKDRVNVVRRALVRMNVKVSGAPAQAARSLDKIQVFERGAVEPLGDGVYITPYPSDEEYFGYVVAGGIKTVVSLMDPKDPEDVSWIEKEKKLATDHGLTLVLKPFSPSKSPAGAAGALVGEIVKLPRPIVIHAFTNPSPATVALREAFETIQPARAAGPAAVKPGSN